MSFRAKVEPLTRVEGHGAVNIEIEDKKVKDVRMSFVESPRFFESLLVGTRGEEAPRTAQRICGICYIAHSLVSVKAIESAWGIEPPERAEKLRRIMHLGGILSSHLLHLAYLATTDYIGDGGKFPQLMTSSPQLFKTLIGLYSYSNNLTEAIGGRRVHTTAFIPGGMAKPVSKEQVEKLAGEAQDMASSASEAAERLLEAFDRSDDKFTATPAFRMAMTNDGQHELYDGRITVLDPSGDEAYGFRAEEYMENVAEESIGHSYAKYPYLRREGFPRGIYRTGCLPRMEIARRIKGDRAQGLYENYKGSFKPGRNLVAYNSARAIEVVSLLEQIRELLREDPHGEARIGVTPAKGTGVGLVEAPRGILIHQYETDSNGVITKANVITPTTQNAPSMEKSIQTYVEEGIDKFIGPGGDDAVREVERLIRCYDPCISCSVHVAMIGR